MKALRQLFDIIITLPLTNLLTLMYLSEKG